MRSTRRGRRKSLRGGKLLGVGLSGYVHYGKEGSEMIKCKDGSEWKEGEVAKVGRDLSDELMRVKNIQQRFPAISEFAILPTRLCEMDESEYVDYVNSRPDSGTKMMLQLRTEQYQDDKELHNHPPQILFAPYGGQTLTSVSGPNVVKALETLRNQVEVMNSIHKIYHQDIGFANIVYADGKAYLIDFGTAIFDDEDELSGESPDLEMMDAVIKSMKSKRGGSRRKYFQRSRK